MVDVKETKVNQRERPDMPQPTSEENLFQELMDMEEFSEAPDVAVEGDWTVRTTAGWQAGLQYASGVKRNDFLTLNEDFSGPEIAANGTPSGLEAAFGSGDTSMTVGVNNDYFMSNSYGANSTSLYNGSESVAEVSPGDKAIVYNPPSGKIVQLIGQFEFGIQFQALAAILERLPELGAKEQWNVPSFGTADGQKSLSAYYQFNAGVPRMLTNISASFTFQDAEQKNLDIVLRKKNGNELARQTVELSGSESYDVNIVFTGLLSSGLVEFHTPGEPMIVYDTAIRPRRL